MLTEASIVISTIIYQKKLWNQYIITDKSLIILIAYFAISLYSKLFFNIKLLWIVLLEESVFRVILLQGVKNTTVNNLLSGLIFALYTIMVYFKDIRMFIMHLLMGYLLSSNIRKISIYELSIIRTLFYLFFK
jgi:hypothetical protein